MAKNRLKTIVVTYTCKGEEIEAEVDGSDFVAHEDSCESCGVHGEIEIEIFCKHCGKNHSFELRSW